MILAGFHRAALRRYTAFKSSPYTEGALFYGEKLVVATARDAIRTRLEALDEVRQESRCETGST